MENNNTNYKCENRVYLTGRVGHCKIINAAGKRLARFSLATNEVYKTRSGEQVEETTWHSITYWENAREGNLPLDEIVKGAALSVRGKLRANKYMGADGAERTFIEVAAFDVTPAGAATASSAASTDNDNNGDLPF